MNAEMKENFSELYGELNILRYELKKEIDAIKSTTEDLEKSMEEVWESIVDLKENDKAQKAVKAQQQSEAEGLKKELGELRKKLEEERERNIEQENYTRQENIKLMNIPETKNRDITTREFSLRYFESRSECRYKWHQIPCGTSSSETLQKQNKAHYHKICL